MAKASLGGYDGKGTRVINCKKDLINLAKTVDVNNWFLEKWIPYERELALISSRDSNGQIRHFPLVETSQSQQVCNWVIAPADISHSVKLMAHNIASSLLVELNYFGVMAIEFFYGEDGLQINEIAPRTHNSAHFSIEACSSSQFDQYICISSGIKPPEINMHSEGSLMINLLGLKNFHLSLEKRIELLSQIKGSNLHWYGKSKESVGRKMAHITFLINEENHLKREEKSKEILNKVREIWPSPNK